MGIKPVIYQLVVRYFGNVNTTNQTDGSLAVNGCGRFNDVSDKAIQSLRDLGATYLWLTGCIRQATLTDYSGSGMPADHPDVVKGLAGSMYAVRDYYDVCPDYAQQIPNRIAEFEALVRRIHQAGLKVIIDFIPNHVARAYHSVSNPTSDFGLHDDQSQSFSATNQFFYLPGRRLTLSRPWYWNPPGIIFDGQFPPEDGKPGHTPKVTGNNCACANPPDSSWYETIKLNYGFDFQSGTKVFVPRPATWDLMDGILAFWQAKGVDGFRCDMAYYIPVEAWKYLISAARSTGRDASCLFIAEAYPGGGNDVPVHDLDDLIAAGFDAFYHSTAYDKLKQLYQGHASLDDYDQTITPLSDVQRPCRLAYLEEHDERRIASSIQPNESNSASGFGSAEAGYQLAPVHYLFSRGPLLFFNGQEVGEPGAGIEGFNRDDGRTTTVDYWCMPEFAKWVNGHLYDGQVLSQSQKNLRGYYRDLLALCQDVSICGDGYWGLRYFNRTDRFGDCPDDLYTFARFVEGSGRLILVAANFRQGAGLSAPIRIPHELATTVALAPNVTVRLVLDRTGSRNSLIGQFLLDELKATGFTVSLLNQTSCVYLIQ